MATKKPLKKAASKKAASPTKKPAAVQTAENGLRLRRLKGRQNKKRQRTQLMQQKPLPSAWNIFVRSLQHLYRNKKLFLGILATYGLLYLLFVKGINGNFQLGNLRQSVANAFGDKLGTLSTGVTLYGLMLGTAGSGSTETAGLYQTILVIITSLALIWALRKTYAGQTKLRVRDSFYSGMYPLVPFILTSLFILVELIPALLFGYLFSVVQSNSLTVGSTEQFLSIAILVSALLLSLYWICGSIFAVYIVTLPGGKPVASLKAAAKLVRLRRGPVIRKVMFLPIILLLFSAIVLIPLIIFLAPAAEILFALFSIVVIAVVHSYLYTLYRSLL